MDVGNLLLTELISRKVHGPDTSEIRWRLSASSDDVGLNDYRIDSRFNLLNKKGKRNEFNDLIADGTTLIKYSSAVLF